MVDENSGNRPNFTIFFKTQILTSSFPHPLPWSQKFNVTENGRKWSDAQKWQKCINFSIYCPPLNGIFLSQNSQNWFGFLKWKLGHPLDTWQKKALRSGWIPHLPKKIVARIFTQVIFYREILNLFFFYCSLCLFIFSLPQKWSKMTFSKCFENEQNRWNVWNSVEALKPPYLMRFWFSSNCTPALEPWPFFFGPFWAVLGPKKTRCLICSTTETKSRKVIADLNA